MRYNVTTLLIFIFFASSNLFAQNTTQFTNHTFTKAYFNPGYVSTFDGVLAQVNYRNQWTDFEGSPKVIYGNVQASIDRNRAGVGLAIVNDQIGASSVNTLTGSYAYKINTSSTSYLSIGVSASAEFLQFDYLSLRKWDDLDTYGTPETSGFEPNFGFGFFWKNDNFYVGYSAPRFLTQKNNNESRNNLVRSNYLLAGKLINLRENLKLHISGLISAVENTPLEINASASVIVNERLYAGINYRLGNSVDAFVRYQVNKLYSFTASYDFAFTEITPYVGSSFELMAEFTLSRKDRTEHTRYF